MCAVHTVGDLNWLKLQRCWPWGVAVARRETVSLHLRSRRKVVNFWRAIFLRPPRRTSGKDAAQRPAVEAERIKNKKERASCTHRVQNIVVEQHPALNALPPLRCTHDFCAVGKLAQLSTIVFLWYIRWLLTYRLNDFIRVCTYMCIYVCLCVCVYNIRDAKQRFIRCKLKRRVN